MREQVLDLTISLWDEVDDVELDRLTRRLRDEIDELDVEAVGLAPGITLPPGAKGGPITIGSLVVALASAGVFTGLIELAQVLDAAPRGAHSHPQGQGRRPGG